VWDRCESYCSGIPISEKYSVEHAWGKDKFTCKCYDSAENEVSYKDITINQYSTDLSSAMTANQASILDEKCSSQCQTMYDVSTYKTGYNSSIGPVCTCLDQSGESLGTYSGDYFISP